MVQRPGIIECPEHKIVSDLCLPIVRPMAERHPDLVVWQKKEWKIWILEVVCTWEPLVEKREMEKKRKYTELVVDLANQNPGHCVTVHPIVVGTIGLVMGLRCHLQDSGLFSAATISQLTREVQRGVIYDAVRIIRRHITVHGDSGQ